MPHADFVHLRVHTAYSLSEGAIRTGELAELCRRHRMPAVAITDTNNLFGVMEASQTLAKAGVQPIIGCQMALAREDVAGWNGGADARATPADTIVLLAESSEGYRNLLKLLASAHLEGETGDAAHLTLAALEQRSGGLIALTGGPAGPVGRLLVEGQADAAEAMLLRLAGTFPDRLYVELMRHGMEAEAAIEPTLVTLADRHDLPLVATNEAFFATRDMFEAHDALICIAKGAHVADTERRRLTPEHYLKEPEAMRALFADLPDAVDNTLVVARRCAFMVEAVDPILPPFDARGPEGEEAALREQAALGLEERLQSQVFRPGMSDDERDSTAKRYRERLAYELATIVKMGFAGYFLIVAEFIRWAKAEGIPVGPGRGSGAGSVVAWALTITDLDPLRFGLLFERFLNPERVSMPDFDIDFCQDRRDEVIRHVQEYYGRDRVAQIITFGKLQARAVLRDVGRVMGLPYGQVDKICKLVPNNPANPVTLAQALEAEPQLRATAEEDPAVDKLIDMARRLEGLYRHASTHAAGVVIGDRPLEDLIPLYRDPRSSVPVTGFNMKWVEKAGLVKFDFLGLKTLTVLVRAVELVREGGGPDLDLTALPLDDAKTFQMLGRGDTVGVFQLESAGMRDVLRKLKPDAFEDIIAVVALYRPGPMDNIPSYIRRKHGEEQPDYLYPTLRDILAETYGIIIYQEQVMQIAQELSGYSLGRADLLRRAMGKKIKSEMDEQREAFVDGAVARGVPQPKAAQIFDLVNKFAGYGFNKSHAAAYALVAYQTAYLKANHPVEFMAASMGFDLNHTDKLNGFRQEAQRLGIAILPPDVNASGVTFTVERQSNDSEHTAIRYALAAIKNVGEGAMQALVEERNERGPFRDVADFAGRCDARQINRRQFENLVRAGAFDALNRNRLQLFQGIDAVLARAGAAAAERTSGQMGLFGGADAGDSGSATEDLHLPDVPDWPPMDRLKEEFSAIGFYLSAHPLDGFAATLKRLRVTPYADVLARGRSEAVNLAGTVVAKRERTSGRGSRYAFVQMSDSTGVYEITVFAELLAAARELLEVGRSLYVRAHAQFEGDSVRFTAQAIEALESKAAGATADVQVFVDGADTLNPLKRVLCGGTGRDRVRLVSWLDDCTEVEIALPGRYAVSPATILELQSIPGVREVRED